VSEVAAIQHVDAVVVPEAIVSLEDLVATLPIAVALGIASAGAAAIVRGGFTPTASILFTNARLIPCMATETVHRIVPSYSGGAAGAASDAGARAVASGGHPGARFIDVIRDGFDRGAGRLSDEDGDGLRDSRLLAQLGIVLGLVYMAFLTVWFWATRVRWNPRNLG
jgi:hypothetical protein